MTTKFLTVRAVNIILYCRNWLETCAFYRDILRLPVRFATDWFMEFDITPTARLSIADESRATIKSSRGQGVTLTLQVANADETWQVLHEWGCKPGPVHTHPWGARVFYLYDPEGYRLEVWSEIST